MYALPAISLPSAVLLNRSRQYLSGQKLPLYLWVCLGWYMYALLAISLFSAALLNQCRQDMSAQKILFPLCVFLRWQMINVCITGHISLQCCLVEPEPPIYERSEASLSRWVCLGKMINVCNTGHISLQGSFFYELLKQAPLFSGVSTTLAGLTGI